MNRVAVGRTHEQVAADVLCAAGFVILWRNLRIGPLEVDLVAQNEDLVVIVEVRYRGAGAFEGPLASVTYAKRASLLRAAQRLWRTRLRHMRDVRRVRIDVIGINENGVEWIPGAVTAD